MFIICQFRCINRRVDLMSFHSQEVDIVSPIRKALAKYGGTGLAVNVINHTISRRIILAYTTGIANAVIGYSTRYIP